MAEWTRWFLRARKHTWAVPTVTSLRVVAAPGDARRDMLPPLEPCVCWCLHREWN